MKELFGLLLIAFIAVAIVIGILAGIYALIDPPLCAGMAREMGMPHQWKFWTGCMIEPEPGKWVPLDKWRYVSE